MNMSKQIKYSLIKECSNFVSFEQDDGLIKGKKFLLRILLPL